MCYLRGGGANEENEIITRTKTDAQGGVKISNFMRHTAIVSKSLPITSLWSKGMSVSSFKLQGYSATVQMRFSLGHKCNWAWSPIAITGPDLIGLWAHLKYSPVPTQAQAGVDPSPPFL